MRIVRLNGRKMRTKKMMYDQYIEAFSLPDYFGNNLDALWDVLMDIDEPTLIEFTQILYLLKYLDSYGYKVLEVFQLLEAHNENVTVRFYEAQIPDDINKH